MADLSRLHSLMTRLQSLFTADEDGNKIDDQVDQRLVDNANDHLSTLADHADGLDADAPSSAGPSSVAATPEAAGATAPVPEVVEDPANDPTAASTDAGETEPPAS